MGPLYHPRWFASIFRVRTKPNYCKNIRTNSLQRSPLHVFECLFLLSYRALGEQSLLARAGLDALCHLNLEIET